MTTHLEMIKPCTEYELINEQSEYVCELMELDTEFDAEKWDGELRGLVEGCVMC